MKYKFIALSLIMAGACATMSAQSTKDNYYTPKWNDNIFVSVGGGIHSINNDGFNKVAPHFNISLGKYITPTWGIRAQVNGLTQHLCLQDNNFYEHDKSYIGANIDAMLNISSLLAGANPNRFFEVYGFVGPQVSVAKSQNVNFKANLEGEINWYSSDENVATVSGGKVLGVNPGAVTITVVCGEVNKTYDIIVKGVPVLEVSGEKDLIVGETLTLTVKQEYLESEISWATSDEAIATVKDGVVTAVGAGSATITEKRNNY